MNAAPVSLIIATYNRGSKIAATVDSVLRQTRPVSEIIVVDDCSPDKTGEWVQHHYAQVKVVSPPHNLGSSGARNLGADAAQQPWLMFLDHDDELLPHAVDTLWKLHEAFPEARACYADHQYTNRQTGQHFPNHHTAQPAFARLHQIPAERKTPLGRTYGQPMYQALLAGNLLQQPWMIERLAFRELSGFDAHVKYCEDWELYLRVVYRYPVALSDEVISEHVIEGENLHLNPNQDTMHRKVIERARQREPLWHQRTRWMLCRRLAGYHKSLADRYSADPWASWNAYLRSFWYWPFDYVVAARALAILPWKCGLRLFRPARG